MILQPPPLLGGREYGFSGPEYPFMKGSLPYSFLTSSEMLRWGAKKLSVSPRRARPARATGPAPRSPPLYRRPRGAHLSQAACVVVGTFDSESSSNCHWSFFPSLKPSSSWSFLTIASWDVDMVASYTLLVLYNAMIGFVWRAALSISYRCSVFNSCTYCFD